MNTVIDEMEIIKEVASGGDEATSAPLLFDSGARASCPPHAMQPLVKFLRGQSFISFNSLSY